MKKPYKNALDQYKTIELKARVDAADPHELINLLLQGARANIIAAQGSMARKQTQAKGEYISKALGIVAGLKSTLNHEEGGEISANLLKIYDHLEVLLLKANLYNNEELLVQANQLLTQVHEAWQSISPAAAEN